MYRILTLLSLCLCACTPALPPSSTPAHLPVSPANTLSITQRNKIGQKIWQNESAGKLNGLTAWNHGEEFPSMGIGHFIWYPKKFQGRWTESFPQFISYAQAAGRTDIPAWVLQTQDCPWNHQAEFQRDFNGPRLRSLRDFLSRSVTLQTDFIITRSQAALPSMLAATPVADRARVSANFSKLSAAPSGAYALIDYVNFKGEGTNLTERYQGQGWGLLQVLQEMRNVSAGQAAAIEFASSAKRVLDRRIKNSPPARGESRWRAGWHNRCDTYAQAL